VGKMVRLRLLIFHKNMHAKYIVLGSEEARLIKE
jgi:hypothetical protein